MDATLYYYVWYATVACKALAVARLSFRPAVIRRFPFLFAFLSLTLVQSLVLIYAQRLYVQHVNLTLYRDIWIKTALIVSALELLVEIEALDRAAAFFVKFSRVFMLLLLLSAVAAVLTGLVFHSDHVSRLTDVPKALIDSLRMIYAVLLVIAALFRILMPPMPKCIQTHLLAIIVYAASNLLGNYLYSISDKMYARWIAQFAIVIGTGIACVIWSSLHPNPDAPALIHGSDTADAALRSKIKRLR